jgi:hypothetical protein
VHHDRSAAQAAGETTSVLDAATASFAEHKQLLVAAVTKDLLADLTVGYAEVNGGPAALLVAGELLGVLVVDPSEQGDRVNAIYSVVNPDKLTRLAGALRERPSAQPHAGDRSTS